MKKYIIPLLISLFLVGCESKEARLEKYGCGTKSSREILFTGTYKLDEYGYDTERVYIEHDMKSDIITLKYSCRKDNSYTKRKMSETEYEKFNNATDKDEWIINKGILKHYKVSDSN